MELEIYHRNDKPLGYLHPRLNLHWLDIVVEEAEDEFIPIFRINQTCAMVKFEFGGNARLVHHHHSKPLGNYGLDARWDGDMRVWTYFKNISITTFLEYFITILQKSSVHAFASGTKKSIPASVGCAFVGFFTSLILVNIKDWLLWQ